jgi:hypothetical protein
VALKQTRTQEYAQLTDNPSTATIERYKAESCVTFCADLRAARDSTMLLIGALDLFTTFAQPDLWTLRWNNELRIRVWGILGVSCVLQVIKDPAQSSSLQYRQMLAVSVFPL